MPRNGGQASISYSITAALPGVSSGLSAPPRAARMWKKSAGHYAAACKEENFLKGSEWLPLITCEHGGGDVPEAYWHLFQGKEVLLQSHRGWDPGALLFARELAQTLETDLIYATVTRLLVDLNRSPHHRDVIPLIRDRLTAEAKQQLMKAYYWPYRNRVHESVQKAVMTGKRVLHISAHSFTPELDGKVRKADIGLLYDPGREGERNFCRELKYILLSHCPGLRVRLNFPYRGTADGLTTRLRQDFGNDCYLGVEVELNQRFATTEDGNWRGIRQLLCKSIAFCNRNHIKNQL